MAALAAVTGATGFLGAHIVRALADRGFAVRVLTRRAEPHPLWPAGTAAVRGDLSDKAALESLVAGADVLVHAAGLTKARRHAEFMDVNRDGTARLAAASANAEARFLLVSSLAARAPHLSPYAASKQAAEAAASDRIRPARLTIVRPAAIYGPWDRETLSFFKLAKGRIAPVVGAPDARFALIHVEDAAADIAHLCATAPGGTVHSLADDRPEGYAMREILQTASAALGTSPRFVTLPAWTLRSAASAAFAFSRLSGRAVMLGPGKAREILHGRWEVSPADLPPRPAGRPTFGLIEGFVSAARWYRSAGWL